MASKIIEPEKLGGNLIKLMNLFFIIIKETYIDRSDLFSSFLFLFLS